MKKVIVTCALLFIVTFSFAQDETKPSAFTVTGYVETYYTYDFNKPKNNTRPAFIYSYNRHNEVNLNLGFLKGSYTTEHLRANLALMTGTYANANMHAEPGVLKNIFEANVGVKLSSRKNLWIDTGVFPSHIGFESAIGKDCWNLTRSILADNTPYFETGVKIAYTSDNGKWLVSGMVLNGWQRIQRVQGSSIPSFGTQITFKPLTTITLNSSSFVGTDKPDSARQMRYFHNLYGQFRISDGVGITLGFDYGIEERSTNAGANSWYSPIAIFRFMLNEKLALAIRAEYYSDENGVIIETSTLNGFRTTGISTNLDYTISPNALWRLELRSLSSKDPVFMRGNNGSRNDTFVSTCLAVSF